MIPTIAMPNVQTPPPIQTSVIVGAPTETSAIRLPFSAVPATIVAPELYNNSRAPVQQRASQQAQTPSLASALGYGSPANAAGAQAGGNGTLFLAQVIAQSGANDNAVRNFLENLLPSSPTPRPELLEQFAQTKYKPSNAAKPAVPASGVAQLVQSLRQSAQPAVAQNIAAVAANTNATATALQAANTDAPARTAASAGQSATRSYQRIALPERRSDMPSLVAPQGFDAYAASLVRNALNISQPPSQIQVAV